MKQEISALIPLPVFLRNEVTKNLCPNLSIGRNKNETASSLISFTPRRDRERELLQAYFLVIARTS